MKRLDVFRNAYFMHESGLVRKDSESDRCVYYSVTDGHSKEDHQVIITLDEESKVIKITCDCTSASIKSKHLPLCSHMMAAIRRAMFEYGRPKKVTKLC